MLARLICGVACVRRSFPSKPGNPYSNDPPCRMPPVSDDESRRLHGLEIVKEAGRGPTPAQLRREIEQRRDHEQRLAEARELAKEFRR